MRHCGLSLPSASLMVSATQRFRFQAGVESAHARLQRVEKPTLGYIKENVRENFIINNFLFSKAEHCKAEH